MELGKIKARIREKGCNPSIPFVVPGTNKVLWVTVQKASLMAALDSVFPTKVSETGLIFDGDKLSPMKVTAAPAPSPAATAAPIEPEAEDDLLADEDDLLAGDMQPDPLDDDEDLLG